MTGWAAFDLTTGVVQGIVESTVARVIDAVVGYLAPPPTASHWLRTPAARAGLHAAMLAALASTAERIDPAAMRFFDPTLLRQPETVALVAGLLLPTPRRARTDLSADLVTIWRTHFADDRHADPAAMAPVADLFVATLEDELRQMDPFRALLDSNTLREAAATLEAVVGALPAQAQRANDRHAELLAILARLEAALQWLQPASAADTSARPPQRLRTLRVAGDVPENLGEIGFLSQRPLLAEGVLYTGSRDGAIHALRLPGAVGTAGAAAGEVIWRCALPEGDQMPEALARWRDYLVVAPQRIDFLSPDKALLLLDRRRGVIAARIPLPAGQLAAPVIDGDLAYLTADGALYAVDLAAQRVAWRLELGVAYCPYAPALDGDLLLLPANEGVLRAIDVTQQRLAWRFTADGRQPHFMATPVVDADLVLASAWNGVLYALDRATGVERWRYSVPEQPQRRRALAHSPVLAGEKVLVGSYDHRIHAVDRRSGALHWISPDLGRRIYSRPVVVGSGSQALLYVTPYRRFLHTLRVEDGQLAWPEAFALEDRGRSDLLLAGDRLVVSGHQGAVELLQVAVPASPQNVAALLASGDWATAAFRLCEEGRLVEAADLYAEHQLHYKAATLYRRANRLREAADAFAHDAHYTPSWRAAARLYQELQAFEHAAAQYERLEAWPAAAQAWEQAGAPARAAALYADRLGETQHAVELYVAAGRPQEAAKLLEANGDYQGAWRILEQTDDARYAGEIARLIKEAVRHGVKDALDDALRRAADDAERADLYAEAGEWSKAAEMWNAAGDWLRAADLLLTHQRTDKAVELLLARAEPEAQRRAAALLLEQSRFHQALDVYTRLGDRAGQVASLRALQQWDQAGELCQRLAEASEHPQMDAAARSEAARWYAEASACFRHSGRRRDYLACRKKVRYYRRLPWLTPSFNVDVDKPLQRGASNLVKVIVANESTGAAHDVIVTLRREDGHVRFTDFRPIAVLGPLQREERSVELRADEHGALLVRVFVQWTNPDGVRQEVEMPEWQASIENPEDLRSGPTVVHVQGDYIQRGEIYHGDVYRDQAYHQAGDRVEISRRGAAPAVGRGCAACGQINPTAAAYCEGCGAALNA
jgi:outer membrane protein assembly factor BamB